MGERLTPPANVADEEQTGEHRLPGDIGDETKEHQKAGDADQRPERGKNSQPASHVELVEIDTAGIADLVMEQPRNEKAAENEEQEDTDGTYLAEMWMAEGVVAFVAEDYKNDRETAEAVEAPRT